MKLQPLVLIGILLVVLGVAGLIYQQVTYTEKETVLDVGDLNITAETRKSIPLPPILGGIALAAGVAMIVLGARKDSRLLAH